MPVDPGANPKDKLKAIGAILFLVVGFIVLYVLTKMTAAPPPK